jgi:hypothetical protein
VHVARSFNGPLNLSFPATVIETAVPAGAREISCALAVAAESLSVSTFAAVFASRAQPAERRATNEAANRVARSVTELPCGQGS